MRFAAHTKASDTPVLPPVYSTTEPPGRSRPSASAASTIASAMRSFMLPVGFSYSSFTRIRALSSGTMRWSGMSLVPPIVSSTVTPSLQAAGGPTRDCRPGPRGTRGTISPDRPSMYPARVEPMMPAVGAELLQGSLRIGNDLPLASTVDPHFRGIDGLERLPVIVPFEVALVA